MKHRSILLAILLLLALTTGAVAVSDSATPESGIHITGAAGVPVGFSAGVFLAGLDTEKEALRGIMVIELPEEGELRYAGRVLMKNEAVTAETLDLLEYVPVSAAEVTVDFTVLPVLTDGGTADPLPVSVTMARQENHPPVIHDVEITTYKDIAVTGTFRGEDPDRDILTYRVTSKAKRGEVEVKEDGTFIYTPFPGKTGKDSFTYIATDPLGNQSEEAKVSVKIEKPPTKVTYADMDGNMSHYAALRLAEEGIFVGEEVCGVHYFRPEQTVSRAEMITMVLKVMGLEGEIVPVNTTGFADDAEIPLWFKGYARTALKNGIINGNEKPDGRKTMNATDDITLSQAVSVLNNAVATADVSVSFTEDITVPVWAEQAAANMDAVGVVRAEPSLDWSRPVTRAEAAQMLARVIDVYAEMEDKSGLLSWVFGW